MIGDSDEFSDPLGKEDDDDDEDDDGEDKAMTGC